MKIAIFGLTHWLEHRITRKLLKIDRYMLRGVWQALNSLSTHATYCVISAGASPGVQTKMWAAVRENGDFLHLRSCSSNNWETVKDRWVQYMLRGLWQALNCLFVYATFWEIATGRPQGKQNVVKIEIFGLTHWLKHRITQKLLKIVRYRIIL